jgi:hypothetical protein
MTDFAISFFDFFYEVSAVSQNDPEVKEVEGEGQSVKVRARWWS